MSTKLVLIVEDGSEYLENLERFVPGPRYLQAQSGGRALELLREEPVELVYLDMRFDRTPRQALLGDFERAVREHGNEPKALRHLATHQGLYILHALREHGHAALPVILAYDFSRELRRFSHLHAEHPSLTWVPDAIGPGEIRARIERLIGKL